MIQDSNLGRAKISLSSPKQKDQLWSSPNLLINGHLGLFPRHKAATA